MQARTLARSISLLLTCATLAACGGSGDSGGAASDDSGSGNGDSSDSVQVGCNAGSDGSLPNAVLFRADNGMTGQELWLSDGTSDGTRLVKDINDGSEASDPQDFLCIGDTVYFKADTADEGTELWKTDTTKDGTQLVQDINTGQEESDLDDFIELRGELLFEAEDGSNGEELWKSDGTAEGTELIKDIAPGSPEAGPIDLTLFDSAVYFGTSRGSSGTSEGGELWRTDGTAEGTELVVDINDGGASQPSALTVFDGHLYFFADDGVEGDELWRSDGTRGSAEQVKDINEGPGDAAPNDFSGPADPTVFDGHLYFNADDSVHGIELWRTDGTRSGTQRVTDINDSGDSVPGWYTVAGGEFYFVAKTGSGENLYRVDTSGDSPSPVKVHDANGISPDHLIALDGEVYFDARVGSDSDEELWRTDGPDAITRVAEINTDTGSSGSAEIIAPEVLDGELLFSATDGDTGRELWKHDPADGTEQVKDINDGGDSSPLDLFAIE